MTEIELSIVVPFLNESEQLPEFLAALQCQQAVVFELLMVDGGSSDGGLEWLRQASFSGEILPSAAGRAKQMNFGARRAAADWLLFLHVDSRFDDPYALRRALDALQQTGSRQLAGHFVLSFRRSQDAPSAGYYFYEWKARLGRPETIHGDQGFLLRRDFFRLLGGFNEELTVMEDTDFAERLREVGQWQLLPAEISTSARRFESEGLWQRQLLGSLIMCFRDIGWQQFFAEAANVYRQQAATAQLRLWPFFQLIRKLLATSSRRKRWQIWWRSGCYVRRHAWQLAFAIDARIAFCRSVPVGQGRLWWCEKFEPLYNLVSDNLLGRLAAMLLLRCWFVVTMLWLRVKESRG